MALHARTFRKAREQVRLMIADGFSATQIKNYLFRWGHWWVEIFASWQLQKILQEFFDSRLPGAHPSGSLAAVKIGNPADF